MKSGKASIILLSPMMSVLFVTYFTGEKIGFSWGSSMSKDI